MKYTGSCHCGNIKFEIETELTGGVACNCSICSRKGTLLTFVPSTQFQLLTPYENITTYTFNKHVIKHKFCVICGVQCFGEGTDPKGNAVVAVNIRCLDNIDLETIPVHNYDGKAI
jgi:hypothetical protein